LAISACAPTRARATKSDAPVVGGFGDAAPSREFTAAAAFAAREQSRRSGTPIRIVKVVRRETQVVAGTNLRMRVIALRNGATPETADLVVYRPLFGHQQLTSWRWLGR
jgi:hypothetical protein